MQVRNFIVGSWPYTSLDQRKEKMGEEKELSRLSFTILWFGTVGMDCFARTLAAPEFIRAPD